MDRVNHKLVREAHVQLFATQDPKTATVKSVMIPKGIVTLTWQGNIELPRTILAQNTTIEVYTHCSWLSLR